MKSILFVALLLGPVIAVAAESDGQNFHQKITAACSNDFARAPAAAREDRHQWIEAHEDSFSRGCKDVLDEIRQQRTLERLLIFSQPHWQR